MAERKRSRRRRDDTNVDNGASQDKPSKDEYAVAKWIRENVPSKKTKFDRNHNVEYFTGTRAVDALLQNSPWSKNRFETREQVTAFLDTMLRHKFFHRAKKVVIPEEELVRIRSSRKKVKELKDDKKGFEKDDPQEPGGGQNSGRDSGRENEDKNEDRRDVKSHEHKKAPKVRLEMHMEQYFVDCNDAYVWIYESTPITYWFFGTCVVFAAIGICLFPLWPTMIRNGVYYLSVSAAGFLVLILALATLRMIVFCLLWLPTMGRCHLWLLPNLTADVGFFASFWPLYQYEYHEPVTDSDKKASKKKRKKSKDSDTEEPSSSMPTPSPSHSPPSPQPQPSPKGKSSLNEPLEEADKVFNTDDMKEGGSPTESPTECAEDGSESSESDKSNTSKDFVMV